jgi:hypothetical protein
MRPRHEARTDSAQWQVYGLGRTLLLVAEAVAVVPIRRRLLAIVVVTRNFFPRRTASLVFDNSCIAATARHNAHVSSFKYVNFPIGGRGS